MAGNGRLVILDKRAASQRGGNRDFARADTLSEEKRGGVSARDFGFSGGRLIRHEMLMPDGSWKKIYPRDEPGEGKGGGSGKKSLVILPGPQGAHRKGKIVVPGQSGKSKGKLILPPGGNFNPYDDSGEKDMDGPGPDEIDDDDLYGVDDENIGDLPCTRDEREAGFGTDPDEVEGRRWLGKSLRKGQD